MKVYRLLLVLGILLGSAVDTALVLFPPYKDPQTVKVTAQVSEIPEGIPQSHPAATVEEQVEEHVTDLPKYDGMSNYGDLRVHFDMVSQEVVAYEYLPATHNTVSDECRDTQLVNLGYALENVLTLDPKVPAVRAILNNAGIETEQINGNQITPYCEGVNLRHTFNLKGWTEVDSYEVESVEKDGYSVRFYPEADYMFDYWGNITVLPGELLVVLKNPDGSILPWLYVTPGSLIKIELGDDPIYLTWELGRISGAHLQVVRPQVRIYEDFPIEVGFAAAPCDAQPSFCGWHFIDANPPQIFVDGISIRQDFRLFDRP